MPAFEDVQVGLPARELPGDLLLDLLSPCARFLGEESGDLGADLFERSRARLHRLLRFSELRLEGRS